MKGGWGARVAVATASDTNRGHSTHPDLTTFRHNDTQTDPRTAPLAERYAPRRATCHHLQRLRLSAARRALRVQPVQSVVRDVVRRVHHHRPASSRQ